MHNRLREVLHQKLDCPWPIMRLVIAARRGSLGGTQNGNEGLNPNFEWAESQYPTHIYEWLVIRESSLTCSS